MGARPCRRVGVCTEEGAPGPLSEGPGLRGGTSQREPITLPVLEVTLMLARAGCLGGPENRGLSRLKRTSAGRLRMRARLALKKNDILTTEMMRVTLRKHESPQHWSCQPTAPQVDGETARGGGQESWVWTPALSRPC